MLSSTIDAPTTPSRPTVATSTMPPSPRTVTIEQNPRAAFFAKPCVADELATALRRVLDCASAA